MEKKPIDIYSEIIGNEIIQLVYEINRYAKQIIESPTLTNLVGSRC